MARVTQDELSDFIGGFVDFILDSEAQKLAWTHHPCDEWLESMVDRWGLLRKRSIPASPQLIKSIDNLVGAVESFFDELDDFSENNRQINQYIEAIQCSSSWKHIVTLARGCKNFRMH